MANKMCNTANTLLQCPNLSNSLNRDKHTLSIEVFEILKLGAIVLLILRIITWNETS